MNIGILIFSDPSRDKAGSFGRFLEAGQALGHTVTAFYETLFVFEHTEKGLQAYYEGKPFVPPEVIIARPNFIEEPALHTTTLEALRQLNIPVLNGSPSALLISKDKLAQHACFSAAQVAMPSWAIARTPACAFDAATRLNFPVIIKVPFGTHGKGVFYAPDSETFLPIVEYLNVRDGNPIIIEKFIAEANRRDLRVFVLGGKVVAAMERTARAGDVRANASLGGSGTPVELSEAEAALALKATRVVGLDLAGVDILRGANGPLLIELNANAEFGELERATGIDVAKAIVEAAILTK